MPKACIPISCSVLSLRDSCVMYPSCLNCVTRLQKKLLDVRCSCPKCGFTCKVQDVNYRYRLSLNVKRNSDIFGVTVFGSCLNPYFGIPAASLQRFLDESKKKAGDPQGGCVHGILIKAVEDCFVGRRFEFGIKLSGQEVEEGSLFNEPRFPTLLNYNSRGFLASWIALPNGAVGGSPVLRYFKRLLQAAGLADLSVSLHPGECPASPEHNDPTELQSFECSSTSFRGSPSQHSHGTGCFPGFWQRSPGIITSSAEQEEHSCSEPDGTAFSSQWRCGKSQRSPHKCPIGTPSHFLNPQDVPLDAEWDVRYNDRPQEGSLGFLAFRDSRETAEPSPLNSLQCSLPSLPDAPESTSSVSKPRNCSSPQCCKIEQSEGLSLEIGRKSLLSEGKDDTFSFQEGLSVCGWGSHLSNSSAWEDLPFTESWGEFISKANRLSEVSPKNNAYDSVKKKEAKISGTGCTDEAHCHADVHQANVIRTCEYSCNAAILSGEATSELHSTKVKEEDGKPLSQKSLTKSPRACSPESTNLSASNPSLKEMEGFRVYKPTLDLLTSPKCQERREGEMPLSMPGSSVLTVQWSSAQDNVRRHLIWDVPLNECNDCVKNETKESNCEGGEAKRHTTVCHGNCCISEHKLGGHGAAYCDCGWEGRPQQSASLCAAEAYNASADLFDSCQNSVDAAEEDKGVTPQSERGPSKPSKSHGCPLTDTNGGEHLTFREKTQKRSGDTCTQRSGVSSALDFVPFLQSTPVSGNLTPLCPPTQRGDRWRQTRNSLVPRGDMSDQCRLESRCGDAKKQPESVRESDSEDAVPSSINKTAYSSELQSLGRSIRRHQPIDRYHCKRILLASGGRNASRNTLSSRTDNMCKNAEANEIGCTLGSLIHVPTCQKSEDCVKCACSESEGPTVREVENASECTACKNSGSPETRTPGPCSDCNSMVCNWSADLFADSFGN